MNRMYNEDQKLRYLKQCKYEQTTIETISVYFNGSSEVEHFYGKDLSEFIHPEIVDMLKKMNSRSRGYLTGMCVFFADYYNWCLIEGLTDDAVNKYDVAFTKRIIEDVIPKELLNNKYFKRDQMINYIDNIYDITNKFIAYALFSGVKGEDFEELINVKSKDLNKDTKELSLITGRTIIVDDYFIDLMEKAESSEKYDEDGSIKETIQDYYSYIPNGYVLKQMKRGTDKPATVPIVQKRLRAIRSQSGNDFLSAPAIYKNGLINHIIKRHRDHKANITLSEILFDEINKKLYTHDEMTREFIAEYGSKMEVKMLRNELKEYIDCFE